MSKSVITDLLLRSSPPDASHPAMHDGFFNPFGEDGKLRSDILDTGFVHIPGSGSRPLGGQVEDDSSVTLRLPYGNELPPVHILHGATYYVIALWFDGGEFSSATVPAAVAGPMAGPLTEDGIQFQSLPVNGDHYRRFRGASWRQ